MSRKMTPRLTKAQEAAMMWLPGNGGDIAKRPGEGAPARHTLAVIYRLKLVGYHKEYGEDWFYLTPAGIAARRELEKRGDVS